MYFVKLQWSHAQPNVETRRKHDALRIRILASMEPRSAERGNIGKFGSIGGELDASMEPRSVERGNPDLPNALARITAASTEPHSVERGKPKCAGRPYRRLSCFNGAALSRTGKLRDIGLKAEHARLASMEPRSAERGNDLINLEVLTTFQQLQWDHVLANVET